MEYNADLEEEEEKRPLVDFKKELYLILLQETEQQQAFREEEERRLEADRARKARAAVSLETLMSTQLGPVKQNL